MKAYALFSICNNVELTQLHNVVQKHSPLEHIHRSETIESNFKANWMISPHSKMQKVRLYGCGGTHYNDFLRIMQIEKRIMPEELSAFTMKKYSNSNKIMV